MKIDISLFSKPQNLFESVGMWFFIVEFIEFANQLQYIYLWLRTVLDFEYVKKSPFLISSFIFSSFSFLLPFAKVITGNWGNRWEKKNIVFGGKPNTFTTNCRFFFVSGPCAQCSTFPFLYIREHSRLMASSLLGSWKDEIWVSPNTNQLKNKNDWRCFAGPSRLVLNATFGRPNDGTQDQSLGESCCCS